MTSDIPKAGQVFDYHYLWKWQDKKGETEGRKKRPSCMALVVVNAEGQHILFIAPITSKQPSANRKAIAIPETEAHRAKLDTHIPLWIIVDELNVDVLEASYTLEDRCRCALINQILRIARFFGQFCTLNYKISTGTSSVFIWPALHLFSRPNCFCTNKKLVKRVDPSLGPRRLGCKTLARASFCFKRRYNDHVWLFESLSSQPHLPVPD